MEWKEMREKQEKAEKKELTVVAVILIAGILFDVLASKGVALFFIKDIEAFTMNIIQLQSSIALLSITIIALLGSKTELNYMGVSYNDYFFNIKPVFLKQKTIIIASLIGIPMSIFSYLIGAYNFVSAIFGDTVILIMHSSVAIYSLYAGTQLIEDEIKNYLADSFTNGNIEIRKKNMCNLCNDWKNKITKQSNTEFEETTAVFLQGLSSIISMDQRDLFSWMERYCKELLTVFLKEQRTSIAGFELLHKIYQKMFEYANKNKEKQRIDVSEFHLFNEVEIDLCECLREMNLDRTSRRFSWNNLFYCIQAVNFGECFSEGKIEGEIEACYEFSMLFGYHRYKNLNQYDNKHKLDDVLSNINDSTGSILRNHKEQYYINNLRIYISYAYGLIVSKRTDIVKESLFFAMLKDKYYRFKGKMSLLPVAIHFYIYYLACVEKNECVEKEIQKQCLEVLQDTKFKENYYWYILKNNAILNQCSDMYSELYRLLQRYEPFPKYESSKTLIMQRPLMQYCAVITALLEKERGKMTLVNNLVASDPIEYSRIFLENDRLRIEASISDIVKHVVPFETNNKQLYIKIRRAIETELKKKWMSEAEQKHNEYEENKIEIIRKTEEEIKRKLKEEFEPIAGYVRQRQVYQATCYTIIPTDVLCDLNFFPYQYVYKDFFENFVQMIGKYTNTTIKRNDYDDENFCQYIEEHKVDVIIDDNRVFKPNKRENWEKFEELANDKKRICMEYSPYGLAVEQNALRVFFRKIELSVDYVDKDIIQMEGERNEYKCILYNDVRVRFEPDEYIKFNYNERKRVKIVVFYSFEYKKEKECIVIEKN